MSTAHRASHRPGGGDEISPADIGAVGLEEFHAVDTAGVAALEKRVAALEATLNGHMAKKAGQAHK